jgi:hypothetical protein
MLTLSSICLMFTLSLRLFISTFKNRTDKKLILRDILYRSDTMSSVFFGGGDINYRWVEFSGRSVCQRDVQIVSLGILYNATDSWLGIIVWDQMTLKEKKRFP